jgi:hypothetical protein
MTYSAGRRSLVVNRETFGKPRNVARGLPLPNWARTALPRATNRGGKLLIPSPSCTTLYPRTLVGQDRESSYREVKETLSVTGSP